MEKTINITLKIWRQKGPQAKGAFETYQLSNISIDSSFLEMLDVLNEKLVSEKKEPVVFDHDCREGICGMCSMYINGRPHGPKQGVTTCQLHMRSFKDGDTIVVIYVGHKGNREKVQYFIKPEKGQMTNDHKDLDPGKVLSKVELTLKNKIITHKYDEQ